MPNDELHGGRQIAGMQVLKLERAALMDCRAPQGDPIEEGAARQVKELTKHILIQGNGGEAVATQGVLQAGVESQSVRAQVKHRRDSAVEHRVPGVSVLD